MKLTFLVYTYLLWLLACGSGATSGGDSAVATDKRVMPSMEESLQSQNEAGGDVKMTEQKIIRNGSMSLKVADAKASRDALKPILDKHKAYVGNEQLDNTDYQTNYTIQIRVPADNLDAMVADIEGLPGTVTYKSIQARDVTEEFIDLETRLTNKKSYLEQYRSLLKNARTIEDILKVREQIRVLEEEIESATGRLKYLSSQVALSTLDLTITQMKDFVYRTDRRINFFERFKESISTGWYGFINFCLYMLGLWPFWIISIGGVWVWRRIRSNRKRKQPEVPRI